MNPFSEDKRSLNTQMVIEYFDKRGIKLSEKDAQQYLDLLYFLAKLIVQQNFL